MKFKRNLQIVEGRIGAVPLVNVALLAGLFFMLSSSYVLQPGVNVEMLDLPVSTLVAGAPEHNAVMVTITRDDLIFYNDERVDLEKLKTGLEETARRFPGIRVVLKSDQRVSYERLVQILDLTKAAGVHHVLLATRPLLNQPATPPLKSQSAATPAAQP
ncbi:MAG: biopolymer transporter ExbD [Verrucomicrobia bacterium]|nr:biopolymer transporter ExbD [Verrucomicrobiota bacterium]